MKKSLLALAVLGAFAGAASAQSSVTLFGTIDLNARYLDNGGGKQYLMSQDGLASSKLGFRGVEDLGGGLNAGFWIEGALNPDTGTPGGQTWKRDSYVFLGGGWGQVRLGRDYTSTFWNATVFDPFGTNGVGSAGNLVLVNPQAPTGQGFDTLVRADNMIGYFLPSGIMGGLYGQVQVAAGENKPGNKYYGGRLGYAAGPFNVSGSVGKTQVDLEDNQKGTVYNFGGSWNFGFMTLSGYWGKIEVADASQDNWYIGGSAPFGLWTFKASYGAVSRSGTGPLGGSLEGQKADQFAIGAVYDLSKRTAFYGTYSYLHNDGNNGNGTSFTTGALQNVFAGGAVPGQNSTGFEVGIKHAF